MLFFISWLITGLISCFVLFYIDYTVGIDIYGDDVFFGGILCALFGPFTLLLLIESFHRHFLKNRVIIKGKRGDK